MMYRGYKIERIDPNANGNWGNKWGVFVEVHEHDGSVYWKQTYGARTVEECKQGIRCHFGRL
jgi:hypothetical protein